MMKAGHKLKKAGDKFRLLLEGIYPVRTIDSLLLGLESLKVILLQGETIKETQKVLHIRQAKTLETIRRLNKERSSRTNQQFRLLMDEIKSIRGELDLLRNSKNITSHCGLNDDISMVAVERLLEHLLPRLSSKTVLDVGSHRGRFLSETLRMGFDSVHAFEPDPEYFSSLTAGYRNDDRVKLHPIAIANGDELPAMLKFKDDTPIKCRSLAALVSEGLIPKHASVLNIEPSRHDLHVMEGMQPGAPYEIIISKFEGDDFLSQSTGTPKKHQVRNLMRENGYPYAIYIVRHDDYKLCFCANTMPMERNLSGSCLYFKEASIFDAAFAFLKNVAPQIL